MTTSHSTNIDEQITEEEFSPMALARFMHSEYERLAPNFGYETRKDTKDFDPTTPNGKLVTAVMAELIVHLDPYIESIITSDRLALLERLDAEIDEQIKASENNLKYAEENNHSDRVVANWRGCIEGEKFCKSAINAEREAIKKGKL